MPFTLAHPAAILPLHTWSRARLPLSALTIGSLTPDFAYFVPYELGPISHSLIGIFTVCWPSGLVAWLIFQYLLKEPTLAILPAEIRRLSRPSPQINAAAFLVVSISLIVGAATHIVWDAFTHAGSPLVAAYPKLQSVLFGAFGYPIPIYKFLQHASTAIGLVAIGIWVRAQWKRARTAATNCAGADRVQALSTAWRIGAITVVVVASLAGALAEHYRRPSVFLERQLFHLAIGGMTGCAIAWCVIAIVVRRLLRRDVSLRSERT